MLTFFFIPRETGNKKEWRSGDDYLEEICFYSFASEGKAFQKAQIFLASDRRRLLLPLLQQLRKFLAFMLHAILSISIAPHYAKVDGLMG